MTDPVKLFIGYASTDSDVVDTVVTRLRMLRYTDGVPAYILWQDKTSIAAGQDWWGATLDGIIGCQAALVFISRAFLQSDVCRAELAYALDCNRVVIPVLIEDTPTIWQEMPDHLSELAYNFIVYDERKFFDALANTISNNWSEMYETGYAPRPTAPGETSAPDYYGQAVAAAYNLQYDEARDLFRKVVNLNTSDSDTAYQWMTVLYQYKELVEFDKRASTRHLVASKWSAYKAANPFETLFDPQGFTARFN